MNDLRTAGRGFALCLLGVYVIQLSSNFLLQPGLRAGGGAAAQPALLGSIVLLGLLSGVIELAGAALLVRTLDGRAGRTTALLYLGLCSAGLAASLAEHGMLLAMRDVGQAAGAMPGIDGTVQQQLLSYLRNGVHFQRMVLGGASVLVFFALAWHTGLLPRALAVLGIGAAAAQMAGVSAALVGGEVMMLLLAPLLALHLVSAVWLLLRGFRGDQPLRLT